MVLFLGFDIGKQICAVYSDGTAKSQWLITALPDQIINKTYLYLTANA